ncbi:hypothetical protein ARAM_005977 [Aspergillus rambellii]|uniref:Aminotransferase class V domain-containing protein n=1 Tax=Aspergillus rambellii TaxID=308745 RepID=A0A0F8UXH3_9EURO|nr:hypothetical protein ARAM_005977 [Aspergillus rambellii]
MAGPTPFGAPMKELFLIDEDFRNLNHGSFGTYPKAIQKVFRDYQHASEARPDVFRRYTQPKAIVAARTAIASLLHVPPEECVLVKNASTGINTVLRNLPPFTPRDVIIYFDTVYGAVERSLVALCESTALQHLRKVEYTFPLAHGEIVRRFRALVRQLRDEEHLNPKLAVFDTIVSMPGVRFPFEQLTRVAREEGVLSVIDAAHGVGQIPLDLSVLQPDFFTTNCHKWLYVPRGCAVLYVPRRHQHLIRTTLPTSWGFIPAPESAKWAAGLLASTVESDPDQSAFLRLFEFVATTDDTAYCCIPEAIKFREEVCGGEEKIYGYLEELAKEAADVVARILGTEVLKEEEEEEGEEGSRLMACAMSNVRLPVRIGSGQFVAESGSGIKVRKDARGEVTVSCEDVGRLSGWIQDQLVERGTFVPVFAHGGALWTRLSAQVYLDISDFEWLGGVLKEICSEI